MSRIRKAAELKAKKNISTHSLRIRTAECTNKRQRDSLGETQSKRVLKFRKYSVFTEIGQIYKGRGEHSEIFMQIGPRCRDTHTFTQREAREGPEEFVSTEFPPPVV